MVEYRADQVRVGILPTDYYHVVPLGYLGSVPLINSSMTHYTFRRDNGLAISQTNAQMWDSIGYFDHIILPADCHFIKTQLRVISPRTAGTLTLKYRLTRGVDPPAIIVSSGDSLDLVIDGTNDEYTYAEVDLEIPEYELLQDDKIEPVLTTDGSWAPTTTSIQALLYFLMKVEP